MFFDEIFSKVYERNYISIGGPFGVGKSSLVNALAKEFNIDKIMELEEEDEFSNAILSAMYSKDRTYIPGTGNEWFLWKRYAAHNRTTDGTGYVMDGSIFQTPVISEIAEGGSKIWDPFNQLVKELCEKVAYKVGIPKLYIILDAKWKTVQERILTRGRKSEVDNIKENKGIFKSLTEQYTKRMIEECDKYRIKYLIVNAKLSVEEQVELIKAKMKELNITLSKKEVNIEAQELPLIYTNTIAIGGMIGAGKSTLTSALEAKNKWTGVQELEEDNPWQQAFLKEFYNTKEEYIRTMFQTYIAQYRNKKYIESINSKTLTVQDRTIFEDRIFAALSIQDEKSWRYYNKVWYKLADKLAYEVGLPKLYIILDMNFKTFKARVMKRGRKSEVDAFDKNLEYFKKLHDGYTDKMKELCVIFHIPYVVIDAKMPTEKQIELINKIAKENNII